ncbi:MAG: hypothetical protein N0C81_20010 [Candidatus Thiodiazotropha lotti]|uniref:Uncharacterized protein n=1 Tax=Candidatus Thiodiazotropha lotti TaxID=2792787 RepID=A0A9E4K5G3_9GAMM|nr:hypothetical protein [Candidatus Thiodiazotropha lotti]ODB99745.1 hypothetical protein A3197_12590 [Candidatus Thiodiazotropha endoloripes]MCG7921481.1 hypothetical protein [Candidatus Thiodiazotropha lotti]MCG7932426.1 hypothetical protein [Candidatus Thiodiazotropha lotti]MCG7939474.1 hypothetical protein [Candidatus Thiodiazotropha lotti]
MDYRSKKKIFFYWVGGVWLGFVAVILFFREFFPEYLGEAVYGWAAIVILIAARKELSQG